MSQMYSPLFFFLKICFLFFFVCLLNQLGDLTSDDSEASNGYGYDDEDGNKEWY